MDVTTTVGALAHLATTLAIGLLLGLEREHDTAGEPHRPAGSRTFPLISLAGAVGAALSPALLAAGLLAVSALVIAWYWQVTHDPEPHFGTTTAVATITAYLLGALAWHRPELAVPAGVVVALLLVAKRPLHRFATGVVSDRDVTDAITLFVVAFVVLPLLPNQRWARTGCSTRRGSGGWSSRSR